MKKFLLAAIGGMTALASMANVYTFGFDGTEDLYGLTRQTSIKEAELEFVKDITFTEAGVNVAISADGTGKGFALVNDGGTNAGLLISTYVATKISMTVPGGNIKSVKLIMSGYALNTLDIDINGKSVFSENTKNQYSWTWTADEERPETIEMTWPMTYVARYIRSIEIEYTEDLGGKSECGLEFNEDAVKVVFGDEFTAPVLSNPNQLPIEWSSSDEKVATVDADGKVTLVGSGDTVIKASTVGNDSFAAGFVKYNLTVIPVAGSLAAMLELAPADQDEVKVNFPMTVTFAKGAFAFVIDEEGNVANIEDIRNQGSTDTSMKTIYKVGDVIPAGWIATNLFQNACVIWQGIPDEVKETVEVVYPEVESVTPEDVNRVVILKDVTFTTPTAADNTKAYGTTPDGQRYEFQDTYGIDSRPAGTYDVTCVVRYAKKGQSVFFWLAPINYTDLSGVEMIEAPGAETRFFNLQGVEIETPAQGIYVKLTNGKASKVIMK